MARRLAATIAATIIVCGVILPYACLGSESLSTTIRASDCIANTTHCHCTMVPSQANALCLKPISNLSGQCLKSNCAAGYKCDCDSSKVCEKQTVTGYTTTENTTATTVSCSEVESLIPKSAVSQTSDFHIIAFQEFQLFVNTDQIGYADSNDYRVFTAEIKSGDVIAVQARRLSQEKFGVKLRFLDLELETRTIDENWFASSSYEASWLAQSFDPQAAGWTHPSIASTVTESSFDSDVPWMWFGTAEVMYVRYVIP